MAKLIGITGRAGSGKTAAAKDFVARGYERLRFADPIKQMARALGLSEAQVDGGEKEVPVAYLCGRTPRYILQTLGTEWGRDLIGRTLWVDLLKWRAMDLLSRDYDVVVDDVRFENEAEAIKRLGGTVIRIVRPVLVNGMGHRSESEIGALRVDHEILNDGTLDELAMRLREVAP